MSVPPPNYTQVPNAMLDVMGEMNEVGLRVALCVARQTKGYQKEKDRLTVTRIMDLTGLSRQGVYDGIAEAKDKWHFIKQEDCAAMGHVYSLDIENLKECQRSRQEVSTELTEDVNLVDTQKKPIKKPLKENKYVPVSVEMSSEEMFNAIPSAKDAPIKDNGLMPILPEELFLFAAVNKERAAIGHGPQKKFQSTVQRETFRACVKVFNGTTNEIVTDIMKGGKTTLEAVVNILDWRRKHPKQAQPQRSGASKPTAPYVPPSEAEIAARVAKIQAQRAARQGVT